MNPVIRRVVRAHRRAILLLVAGLLLNVLAYVLVVRPLSVKSDGAADRAQTAARTLRTAEGEYAAAGELVKGKAQADEELNAFYSQVLPADMTAARRMTYASLPALARRTGVIYEARTTEVEKADEEGHLQRMGISMVLQGDYENLRQFIYGLESAPEFVIIDDVTLAETTEGEALRLTVNLSTYFRTKAHGS